MSLNIAVENVKYVPPPQEESAYAISSLESTNRKLKFLSILVFTMLFTLPWIYVNSRKIEGLAKKIYEDAVVQVAKDFDRIPIVAVNRKVIAFMQETQMQLSPEEKTNLERRANEIVGDIAQSLIDQGLNTLEVARALSFFQQGGVFPITAKYMAAKLLPQDYTYVIDLDSNKNEVTVFFKMKRFINIDNPTVSCEKEVNYKLVYNYKKNTYSIAEVDKFPVNKQGVICEEPDLPVRSRS